MRFGRPAQNLRVVRFDHWGAARGGRAPTWRDRAAFMRPARPGGRANLARWSFSS